MGLQRKITIGAGVEYPTAYTRIDTINGSKLSITTTVNSYTSQQDYQSNAGFLQQEVFTFVPSVGQESGNFIKQGYEYLKTLPDFVEAIDC